RANHYTILGVTPTATLSEVKSAFYKSSMKWHPDRNEGSEEAHKRFLKISEAYSVLSNEQRRGAYDRSL
ncbi:heat shock protein DnaJ, partial [Coemansia reversa NRRL 1564]